MSVKFAVKSICELRIANRLDKCKKKYIMLNMKPQDVVIIIKIISFMEKKWRMIDVAYQIKLSSSEVNEGIKRLKQSNLIYGENKVNFINLQEFLFHGLKYCFPVKIEENSRGIATAHSSRFMKGYIESYSDSNYVWPYEYGESYGLSVKPLYKTVPQFIENDEFMYKTLAYIDVLRLGRVREVEYAQKQLEKILKSE